MVVTISGIFTIYLAFFTKVCSVHPHITGKEAGEGFSGQGDTREKKAFGATLHSILEAEGSQLLSWTFLNIVCALLSSPLLFIREESTIYVDNILFA